VDPLMRKSLNEDKPYLSILLKKCPYELTYNEFPFQTLDNGVKTCGRWCCIRALLKDMDLYQFKKLFLTYNADEIVTLLTS
jgi:hypothetical protein